MAQRAHRTAKYTAQNSNTRHRMPGTKCTETAVQGGCYQRDEGPTLALKLLLDREKCQFFCVFSSSFCERPADFARD
eukprot:745558-Rhodomonas_salina.4